MQAAEYAKAVTVRVTAAKPWRWALGGALSVLLAVGAAWGEDNAELANKIKGGMLVEFARYTTWNKERFALPESPVVIGVVGDEGLADALAGEIDRGKVKVQDRTVAVRKLPRVAPDDEEARRQFLRDARQLHVLYIGDGERRWVREVLGRLAGLEVLTVSAAGKFADDGGMIGLFLHQGRYRFDVNKAAIERVGLKISSKVLELARKVLR